MARWYLVIVSFQAALALSVLAQDFDVACRIEDPTKVGRCKVLKQCAYRVYPVETVQAEDGTIRAGSGCAGFTNLFSMYGGAVACEYFTSLIGTNQGCTALSSIVKRQLEKSDFRGVDLQCDPTMNGINETSYSCCLRQLRDTIGDGYLISVRIEKTSLETILIDTLNEVVDIINLPYSPAVQQLIAQGLSSRKIVVDVALPPVLGCPVDATPLQDIANTVRCFNLFGAIIQLDRDDINNACGEGSFPLLNKLSILLEEKEPCDFEGFIPNPRDRTQFFSCQNGDYVLHQCPSGQLFDRMNSTCIPFVRVACNETACTFIGPIQISNDTQFLPVPIPFPTDQLPEPAPQCDYGDQLEELKKLLNLSGNITTADVIESLKRLNETMGNMVIVLNSTNGAFGRGGDGITQNQNNMDEFAQKLGVLEALLKTVSELIKKVTGLDLGLFSDPAGGAVPGGLPLNTGVLPLGR